jgi:hypothetical protein
MSASTTNLSNPGDNPFPYDPSVYELRTRAPGPRPRSAHPIHEVLFSRDQDMAAEFDKEFSGLTNVPVTLLELNETRQRLRRDLPRALTNGQKRFLTSLANGDPDWSLMACRHLGELPAVRWKVLNVAKLKKINPEKLRQQSEELQRCLDRVEAG